MPWGDQARRKYLNSHYPLGCLVAYAKVAFDGSLNDAFEFAKVTPRNTEEISYLETKIRWDQPAVFLLSSYIWNHSRHRHDLYYLQLDQGVSALDLMSTWAHGEFPGRFPVSSRARRTLLKLREGRPRSHWMTLAWTDQQAAFLFDDVERLVQEVLTLARVNFGARDTGSDVAAIVAAQCAVLPRKGTEFPQTIPVSHDVEAYLRQMGDAATLDPRPAGFRSLLDFPPGFVKLVAQSPTTSYAAKDTDQYGMEFELRSNLVLYQSGMELRRARERR